MDPRTLKRRWINPPLTIACVMLAAVAGASVYLLFRPHSGTAPAVREMARSTQQALGALPVVGLAQPEAIRARLRERFGPALADRPRRTNTALATESAADAVAGYLDALSTGSHEAYAAWSAERGHALRPDFPAGPARDDAFWQGLFRLIADENPDSPPRTDQFFDAAFETALSSGSGALRPVGLLDDPRAIEVDSAEFTHFADSFDYAPASLADGFGDEVWLGGIALGGVRLFEPPADLSQIIDRDGSALVLRLRCVVVGSTGLRIPTHMTMVYDPVRETWFLENVSIHNVGPGLGMGLDDLATWVY
jgi:hypothetical protein